MQAGDMSRQWFAHGANNNNNFRILRITLLMQLVYLDSVITVSKYTNYANNIILKMANVIFIGASYCPEEGLHTSLTRSMKKALKIDCIALAVY